MRDLPIIQTPMQKMIANGNKGPIKHESDQHQHQQWH
jgi:hypothetical protein